MGLSEEWGLLCFSWEENQVERKVVSSNHVWMSHVQVGWGWVEAWRASFLPLYNPAWPSGNGVEGKAEGLLESLVWVCVLQGFHFFLCVCFCCKLPTDVSSWATPDQLEVVMRCCHNCAFCDFFSPLPFWASFSLLQKWIFPPWCFALFLA